MILPNPKAATRFEERISVADGCLETIGHSDFYLGP